MNTNSQIKRVWPVEGVMTKQNGLMHTIGFVVSVQYDGCGILPHFFVDDKLSLAEKRKAAGEFYVASVEQWKANLAKRQNENTK